jgi:D-alanine-D-alanine ligase
MAARYAQGALVEEFLPGREFTVAILGGPEPTVLPPMEVVFTTDAKYPVYSFDHKLEPTNEVRYDAPAKVSPELDRELRAVALRSFQALGCRDVARIDLRLDAAGTPRFIECNPLPGLTPGWSDLCLIADAAGIDYRALIARILAPAIERAGQLATG